MQNQVWGLPCLAPPTVWGRGACAYNLDLLVQKAPKRQEWCPGEGDWQAEAVLVLMGVAVRAPYVPAYPGTARAVLHGSELPSTGGEQA
jgi:hypothetical protein